MEVKIAISWIDIVQLIFGIFGILSFSWIVIYEIRIFINITVKCENRIVHTEVSNRSIFSRKIINAIVIISKQGEDFLCKVQEAYAEYSINCTNDLYKLHAGKQNNSLVVKVLNYYYSENVRIADETLHFSFSIEEYNLDKGFYDVRFFVYSRSNRLHRTNQCTLIIN